MLIDIVYSYLNLLVVEPPLVMVLRICPEVITGASTYRIYAINCDPRLRSDSTISAKIRPQEICSSSGICKHKLHPKTAQYHNIATMLF